jgi:hypothetical protein
MCGCKAYLSLNESDAGEVTLSGNFEHNHGPDGIRVLSAQQVMDIGGQLKEGTSVNDILAQLGDDSQELKTDVRNLQRFFAPTAIKWTGPDLSRVTDLVKKQDILAGHMKLLYSSSLDTEDLLAKEISRLVKMGFHLQQLDRESGSADYLVTLNSSHKCDPATITKCLILCEQCPGSNCEKEVECPHLHISALLITERKGTGAPRTDPPQENVYSDVSNGQKRKHSD